jgi:hypothetical protein
MNKETADKIINNLAGGSSIMKNHPPDIELMIFAEEIITALFSLIRDDEEMFKYVIQQMIIKAPYLRDSVITKANKDYPQHKEYIDKLIVLT